MIGKKDFKWDKLSKKLDNMSLLKIYDPNHK